MASRFLKATGNWADNNSWSATDGGAAGASYPQAGDNAFLTANGNGLTLTLAADAACDSFVCSGATTATLAGTKKLTVGGNVTLLATMTIPNTITFTVTGTGSFAGSTLATLGAINLNGTAHTVSGSFACTVLTRNGTATKTDSVTFTSGNTVTCTTCAMIGNSATNRLLVQSSTLGTPATITATNWTDTANVDIMDITATNAIDLSAITGLSGDCKGNTGITFTDAAAQTSSKASTWADSTMWTSRVPLPQDDVSCSHNVTVDMPRIGKSITFTGTPTMSLSNEITHYGSLTLASGMTYTHNNMSNYFRGRGNYTFNPATKAIYRIFVSAPTGTVTLAGDYSAAAVNTVFEAGTFSSSIYNVTAGSISDIGSVLARAINMGSGVWALNRSDAQPKAVLNSTNMTLTPGTSTIILTNSTTNAQSFQGGGLTYNNVTVQGAGNYALTISGSNTFRTFTVDASAAAKTITFTDTTTQRMARFTRDAGTNVITLGGTGAAGWNVIRTSGATTSVDYITISRSTATPSLTWYAGIHSTNNGNNSGWRFTKPPSRKASGFSIGVGGGIPSGSPYTIG